MKPPSADSLRTRPGRLLDRLTLLGVLVFSSVLFTTPLRATGSLLPFAQDDFYYYLAVARNLTHGLGATFDGSTLTNGYHPLYFLLLWGASYLFHTLRETFGFLAVLDLLSAVVVFLAGRKLLTNIPCNSWMANGLALLLVRLCCHKFYQQMEVTLTLPLGTLFLVQLARRPDAITPWRWMLLGVTAALTFLSRLDSLFLLALCLGGCLLESTYRSSLTREKIGAFTAGFAPLPALYVLVDEQIFHRASPVSGAAKQLGPGNGWNWNVLINSASPETGLLFLVALLTLLALPWWWSRVSPAVRVVGLGGLLFPFVHWGVLLSVSDWKLWGWYSYSLCFAMLATMLIGVSLAASSIRIASSDSVLLLAYGVFGVGVLSLLSAHYKVDPEMRDIAVGAKGIRAFTASHPGRYAMGDRAGMVGYIDGVPTIQTEGLMMDTAFLDHIRRQEPLKQVLTAYGVNYYIAFERGAERAGCFEAREPANAGPKAPVMRGEFCEAPLDIIPVAGGRTLIFAVK